MRAQRVLMAVTAGTVAVALAACGQTNAAQPTSEAPTTTSRSSSAPTTTTVPPTTTAAPTTTTTQPKPTTTKPSTTKPKPTTTKPKPTPSTEAPCDSSARACIDLSANQSWLMSEGKVVYGPVKITHGRPGWLTPPGTFKVGWKSRHHKSRTFNNAPMPWSVFFNGGIAFHQGSLSEKSHGCIHLSPAAAQKYFEYLAVGDVVQVVR